MANPGVRPRRTPPRSGPNSFGFAYVFAEKRPRQTSPPPMGNPGLAPEMCMKYTRSRITRTRLYQIITYFEDHLPHQKSLH